ncbi:hypothetical protein B0H11DRAFT_2218820 [Mycena galericulata]|nr:hypothetical protein B0H11DRAFT_2218820 [Mycena galericulata]
MDARASFSKVFKSMLSDMESAIDAPQLFADVLSAVQQLDPLVVRTIAAKIAAGPIVIDSDGRN